ncbi:MAG TPA: hypothetical protein VGL34_18600 [Steroidobacteraceae bacterium]
MPQTVRRRELLTGAGAALIVSVLQGSGVEGLPRIKASRRP